MKEIKMKNSNTSGLIKHLQNTHLNIYKDILKDRPIKPSPGKSAKVKSSRVEPISIECSEFQEDLKLKTEENLIEDEKNESSESVFSYSDPLLYNEENNQLLQIPEEKRPNNMKSTEDIVKFLLEKQFSQDDADIQGKSWASQYRQLSLDQQIHIKKRIDDIFYEARIENLHKSQRNNIPMQRTLEFT
ncbi:hypothetical protein ACFFRR_007948 [Megaselia abdita]